jgi:hypothetical protein
MYIIVKAPNKQTKREHPEHNHLLWSLQLRLIFVNQTSINNNNFQNIFTICAKAYFTLAHNLRLSHWQLIYMLVGLIYGDVSISKCELGRFSKEMDEV